MALNYTKTNTFTTGTTISSSAVNANFDDVVNAFGGLENLSKSLSNLLVDTILRSSGTIQSADGTVSAPGVTFTSDTNTGLYSIAGDNIGIATNGTKRFDISTTGITSTLPLAMGSSKITGLAAATTAGDALRFEQMKIVQYSTGTSTTNFSTTSSTFQTTNLSASIQPSSASSKVLILASCSMQLTASGGNYVAATIAKGGSNLLAADGQAVSVTGSSVGASTLPVTIVYVDSPASTSSLTYAVQIRSSDNATQVNFPSSSRACTQFIVLAELA